MEIEFWEWHLGSRGRGVCSRVSYVAEHHPTLSARERKEGNPDKCAVPFFAVPVVAHDVWEFPTASFPLRGNPPRWVSHESVRWVGFVRKRKKK